MVKILDNSAIDLNTLDFGSLIYAQVPVAPVYPFPPSITAIDAVYTPIPSLIEDASVGLNGINLNTDGSVFDGIPGYQPIPFFLNGSLVPFSEPKTFSATANTGYAGFTNYTIDLDNLNISNINSLTLEPVDPNFPALDPNGGFTVEFDLAIAEEASVTARAGFSVTLISSDVNRGIELGFKAPVSGGDRIFAQNFFLPDATEGESTPAAALDLSQLTTYQLSVKSNTYRLSANGQVVLQGQLRNYSFDPIQSDPPFPATANPYETPNLLFFGDNTDGGYADFTLGDIDVLSLVGDLTPDLYDDYIASYGDLIQGLGYNPAAAKAHFDSFGWDEGRSADLFDEGVYLASHGDLIQAFGYDLAAATRHYIEFGFAEGRLTQLFIPEYYLSAYSDLQAAFGGDTQAATWHYIQYGFAEGRDPLLGFDAAAYIASYDDLIQAFGYDPAAGRQHFLLDGFDEGRTVTFQPDDYLASHGDLIQTFGYNLAAATEHYIRFGAAEGRSIDNFDEVTYLSNYQDLRAAFGNDLAAATRHYVQFGFAEGRTDQPLA